MGKRTKNYDDIMNKAYFDACDNLRNRDEPHSAKSMKAEMRKILKEGGHEHLMDKV